MSLVVTAHESTTCGCTHGVPGITVSKSDALLRHAIDVGSADRFATITTEIMVAHIIDHDKYDVGQLGS